MAMNIDFTGKTVLVTGGGRGLGKEMALQFAGCGANVYIANRKEDQGLATVKEIEALGVKGGFTKCDVAVEEDVKKLIADAAAFRCDRKCSRRNFPSGYDAYNYRRGSETVQYQCSGNRTYDQTWSGTSGSK